MLVQQGQAGSHLGFFVWGGGGEVLLGILDHTHFCRYCMLLIYSVLLLMAAKNNLMKKLNSELIT